METTKNATGRHLQCQPAADGSPSTERTAALCKHSIPTPIVDYSTPSRFVTAYTAPRTAARQVR